MIACLFFFLLAGLFSFKQSLAEEESYIYADSSYSYVLKPTKTAEYYVEQGVKYFRTMESSVPIKVKPNYADRVCLRK